MSVGPMQILLVIALVFLLIWFPKQLPKMVRGMGDGIREFKKAKTEVSDAINTTGEELNKVTDSIKKEIS